MGNESCNSGIPDTVPNDDYARPANNQRCRGLRTPEGPEGTWSIAGTGGSQAQRVANFRPGAGNLLTLDEAGQLTEFNLDNNKLTLIHYCARGNQPRMRLEAANDRKLVFRMYDITNLSHPHAYHTTGLDVIFLSDDRVDLLYRGTQGGRASTQTVQLTRKR